MPETCPEHAVLRDFIADALSFDDNARVAAHVESCDACLRTLEELSDTLAFRALRERDSDGAAGPSPDLLKRISARISTEVGTSDGGTPPRANPRIEAPAAPPIGPTVPELAASPPAAEPVTASTVDLPHIARPPE